jgi:hypothetical protein
MSAAAAAALQLSQVEWVQTLEPEGLARAPCISLLTQIVRVNSQGCQDDLVTDFAQIQIVSSPMGKCDVVADAAEELRGGVELRD